MPCPDSSSRIWRLFLAAVTDATELCGNPTASATAAAATAVTSSTPITASIG